MSLFYCNSIIYILYIIIIQKQYLLDNTMDNIKYLHKRRDEIAQEDKAYEAQRVRTIVRK